LTTEELPPLESLNTTELCEMIRKQIGVVVRRDLAKPRLIEIVEYGQAPKPEELSGTSETREILQAYLEKNWSLLNSQIPCKGTNRGKCRIYPCPEGRHLDCYLAARTQIRTTFKKAP